MSKELSILISTADDRIWKNQFLLNLDTEMVDVIIIHQQIEIKQLLEYVKEGYTIISVDEKGLSKSRNRALQACTTPYAYILDDDVQLFPEYYDKIMSSFKKNKTDSVLTFMAMTPDLHPFKTYSKNSFSHNWKSIAKVSSIEMALNMNLIKGIRFDEMFGLGASYPTGEELIFLSDVLTKNLSVRFIPQYITIHPAESSGRMFDNDQLVIAKGALFQRVFGWKSFLMNLFFSLKKYSSYKANYSFVKFFSLMNKGRKLLS